MKKLQIISGSDLKKELTWNSVQAGKAHNVSNVRIHHEVVRHHW